MEAVEAKDKAARKRKEVPNPVFVLLPCDLGSRALTGSAGFHVSCVCEQEKRREADKKKREQDKKRLDEFYAQKRAEVRC